MAEPKLAAGSIGTLVGLGLGVLTIVEYLVAVASLPGLLILLAVMALAKAWLIAVYFMHIGQLRREGR